MFKPGSAALTLVVVSSSACWTLPSRPDAGPSPVEHGGGVAASAIVAPQPAHTEDCADDRFVPCSTSEACTMRAGKLIARPGCFVHAADACRALGCEHGCDIYHGAVGEPEMIHCAINASSSSNMQRCAGYSNWACPEKMTCQEIDPHVDDAEGICVPNR